MIPLSFGAIGGMKKIILRIIKNSLFFLVVVIVGIMLLLWDAFGSPFDWIQHNKNLDRFAQEFDRIPLPQGSQQTGTTYKHFGLMGNGNHCDYYASKLFISSLPRQTIENFYTQYTVPPVNTSESLAYDGGVRGTTPNSIRLNKVWEDIRKLEYMSKDEYTAQHNLTAESIAENTYEISVLDYGYTANDYRCH